MSQEEVPISDDIQELEHQVEKGYLFAHTVLTEQILRINENESFIYGLIDYLIQKDIVQPEELKAVVESVRRENIEKREFATLGVAIRLDGDEDKQQTSIVNCDERLHICHAVCCRLRFALSVEEIETGRMKWELGKPYYNRHRGHGYCHQMDPDQKSCSVYADRPSICRKYNCANDQRIWKDFEQMELNQEWIDSNLNQTDYHLIEVFMDGRSLHR